MNDDLLMLIDMHNVMHRAHWAFKNLTLEDGTPTGMIYGTINILLSLISKYDPKHLIVCYDGGSDRRKAICSNYKSSRKKLHNGFYQQLLIIKQILSDLSVKQVHISGEEADDTIGSISNSLKERFKIMIVSNDHDFFQLVDDKIMVLKNPNIIYNKNKVEEEYGVLPDKLIDVFSLTGDDTDDVIGLKGVGIKKAVKLINEYDNLNNLLEKSETEEKLLFIKDNKDVIMLANTLVKIKTDLNIKIKKGGKNLELVKFIFKDYLKFNSFLSRWDEIEKLSNL